MSKYRIIMKGIYFYPQRKITFLGFSWFECFCKSDKTIFERRSIECLVEKFTDINAAISAIKLYEEKVSYIEEKETVVWESHL